MKMAHSLCMFVVMATLLGSSSESSNQVLHGGCAPGCLCDSTVVTCSGISGMMWMAFLDTIPSDTTSLVLQDSSFTAGDASGSRKNVTLSHLHTLKLVKCDLTYLNLAMFYPMWHLTQLCLDGNNISELDGSIFTLLEHLVIFTIEHNHIASLLGSTIQHSVGVQILMLAENKVPNLPPTVLRYMTLMEVLNLSLHQPEVLSHGTPDTSHLEVEKEPTLKNQPYWLDVNFYQNQLECNCGLLSFVDYLANQNESSSIVDWQNVTCHKSGHKRSVPFQSLSEDVLHCQKPKIVGHPDDHHLWKSNNTILHCNATGFPKPSVYWITPTGQVLTDPGFWKWVTSDGKKFHRSTSSMHYVQSMAQVREDSALVLTDFHLYLSGVYTCVAESPSGMDFIMFNLTISSPFQNYVHFSMIIGGATALGFFMLLGVVSSVKMCCIVTMRIMRSTSILSIKKEDAEEGDTTVEAGTCKGGDTIRLSQEISDPSLVSDVIYECEEESSSFYRQYSPAYGFGTPLFYPVSPWDSPKKCATPAEDIEAERKFGEMSADIVVRLNDVRDRLRHGVERHVVRIRSHAQTVRDNSSRYMQHIRDNSSKRIQTLRASSSQYIHNIRSSSSQYAGRVRAGVVLGVEQVKYHVQSMKELCGTGDVSHTISIVSVSTNVDSLDSVQVVKTITHTYV